MNGADIFKLTMGMANSDHFHKVMSAWWHSTPVILMTSAMGVGTGWGAGDTWELGAGLEGHGPWDQAAINLWK